MKQSHEASQVEKFTLRATKPATVQIVIEVPVSELDFSNCNSSIDANGKETLFDDDVSCARFDGHEVYEFYTEVDRAAAVEQMHTELRGW